MVHSVLAVSIGLV